MAYTDEGYIDTGGAYGNSEVQDLWGQAESNAYGNIGSPVPSVGGGPENTYSYRDADGNLISRVLEPPSGGAMDSGGGITNSNTGKGGTKEIPYQPSPGWYSSKGEAQLREERMNAQWEADKSKGYQMGSGRSMSVSAAPSYPGMPNAEGPVKTTRSYMEAPSAAAPTYVAPVFERPQVDEQALNRRIQESLNPALSNLRSGIRESIARSRSSNPALQRYMMEGMMKGYGQGLGDATSKAQKEGRQSYMEQDYKPQWDTAQQNFQARMAEAQTNWQTALKNWQNMWTNVQETSTTA
jgi:hypothetical protein